MSNIEDAPKVALVGSPSTNFEVTLNLNSLGRSTPLVGTMLALVNPLGEGFELAIGTVTEVTTTNKWMEEDSFRGVASIAEDDAITFSGDSGDLRNAKIRLQAAWRKSSPDADWIPSGPSLRMSPATGQPVRLLDGRVIGELTKNVEDKHYIGNLGGTEALPLPLSIPDFAGPAGAIHFGIYGQSGSGKALSLDTPIPTPTGWTTMGELQTGDKVFDEKGNPCTVVQAHEVLTGRDCYEVVFSDGTKIIADADHLWQTESAYARYRESLERTGLTKRNTLLSKRIRKTLKDIASSADSADLIVMSEVAALTGLNKSSTILKRAAQAVGSSGTIVPVYAYNYKQATAGEGTVATKVVYKKGAPVVAYPKASILNYIAEDTAHFRGDQRHKWIEPAVAIRTTKEIAETLTVKTKGQALNHAIQVADALNTPEIPLTVDPYLLGVWLGDGMRNSGVFCGVDHEIADILTSRGHSLIPTYSRNPNNPEYVEWRVEGLLEGLTTLGVRSKELHKKHIPAEYLRASISQRRELLAGLLDTDGTVSPQGGVQFDNTNELLVNQVLELARSLGYRATKIAKKSSLYGKDLGITYRVSWTTDEPVFFLTRKLETQRARSLNYNKSKNSRRYIVAVNKVESVPVRCITVDSPNHLFLAGEAMIPTHNTQMTSYLLAGQMRHSNLGMIIVDPQGQWAAEEGMAFSLQGFAAELGKDVRVVRISEHLQLSRDAGLFTTLLGKTRFLKEITKMSEDTQNLVLEEMAKIIKDIEDWHLEESKNLMLKVFATLVDPHAKYMSRIYADETRQDRLREAINEIIDSEKRAKEVLRLFAPIHNLFQPTNPMGGARHSLWAEISAVFERDGISPAPLLILDMSSKAPPGMDDEAAMAAADAYEVLENDSVKAAILRNLFSTLKRASEAKFRDGVNLNTMVILDEAWRYAPNPSQTDDYEIAELSRELAGYARDTRKFGIGWLYISQSTRSVNLSIWEQMSIRVFGFGLSGIDLDKIAEIVDDKSSLRLYRAFGNPRATGRYPFLLTGPVSPLAANATPIVLTVYTDFQSFRDDNEHWIKPLRDKLGLELLSGAPKAPTNSLAKPKPKISSKAKPANPKQAIVETNTSIKDNLDKTGVKNPDAFGNPLDNLDDSIPF